MKYKNKDWLNQKYSIEKLSARQIATILNCGHKTVTYYLKKYNIIIRSKSNEIHKYNIKRIGNNNYCNKKWLEEKYLIEKLSTSQIAKLCNCGQSTIYSWIKKHKIKFRSCSESAHLAETNHCNLSNIARQWIDGELLGDGCLQSQSKYSALFSYSSKYMEYINYVSKTLNSFGIKQAGKIYTLHNKEWDCYTYQYRSLSYVELLSIKNRWYPEPKKKKIIPRDLKITPLLLRQEYIGDGSLNNNGHRNKSIGLCTNGFPVSDVRWLAKQLENLGFKSSVRKSSNTIGISTESTRDFINYIGKCPIECYEYKWNL